MANSNLRINMTGTESEPNARAKRYQTAIDMAAYADQHGFTSVNVEEHHLADNGWLPSPITMASAIAARTDHVGIGVMALLVSLYDPIRLAEDLAVLDLLAKADLILLQAWVIVILNSMPWINPMKNVARGWITYSKHC